MRYSLTILVALTAAHVSGLAVAQPPWTLVWSDEFDHQVAPDPAKCDYEVGFVRNGEAQYYTRARPENARVENGMLAIEGRKEHFPNPDYDRKATPGTPSARQFLDYTAASLITKGKADWKFGRIEVRAKLPQGGGVWPAIWMVGSNFDQVSWPRCGEIDIVEFVGNTPDKVYATVHFAKDGQHAKSGGELTVHRPFDDFHVYAVEWFADHMDFYFDQQKYHTFAISQANEKEDNPFVKPQFLMINLVLGGSWGGHIDDNVLPQKFLIDYVRIYEQRALPAAK